MADDLDPAAVERAAGIIADGADEPMWSAVVIAKSLAAAGLLVTPERPGDAVTSDWDTWVAEHDAQVVARAAEIYRLAPRFWRRVAVGAPSECWPWTGPLVGIGHGRYDNPAGNLAHRYAWAMQQGRLPRADEVIRHACDNPACCNPAHLLAGTQQDNVDDMFERGRGAMRRGFCKNGHEIAGENVLVRPDGKRRCKACTRAAQAERRREPGACPICGATFSAAYNVGRHVRQMHPDADRIERQEGDR